MKTIAIIDDDIHIGNILEELLRQEGYRTLRAYSGTEALYLLSENRPDLILLDLMLPGLLKTKFICSLTAPPTISPSRLTPKNFLPGSRYSLGIRLRKLFPFFLPAVCA